MRFAHGHCWRQDAGPDGHSAAPVSPIDRSCQGILTLGVQDVDGLGFFPYLVRISGPRFSPDIIQIIFLMVSGELMLWILVWLEQDFWNRNSEGFSLFSTLQVLLWKWLHLPLFPSVISVAVSSQICCKELWACCIGYYPQIALLLIPKHISSTIFLWMYKPQFPSQISFSYFITSANHQFWLLVFLGCFSLPQKPENTTIGTLTGKLLIHNMCGTRTV